MLGRIQDREDDGPPTRGVLVVGGSGAKKHTLLYLLCREGEIWSAAELSRQRTCSNRLCVNRCYHLNGSSFSFSTPAGSVPVGPIIRLGFGSLGRHGGNADNDVQVCELGTRAASCTPLRVSLRVRSSQGARRRLLIVAPRAEV